MNLRDQLKEILPEILPRNPAEAVKGTELIELVKYRLHQDYSDATLRYHFSIMSCDPSSPIAKVEQGQGYYLRTTTIHSLNSARNLISPSQAYLGGELSMTSGDVDQAISRASKFRAVFQRYCEVSHVFPFTFERSFSDAEASHNRWRYPDAAIVEWQVGALTEDGYTLDKEQIELQRRLGNAPLRVTAVKLKLEVTHQSLRESFFQCLSTSSWANAGELVLAAPAIDEQLVEEIRVLAGDYGIGVTTFGLDADILDDMPEPAAVENLMPREFEAIQSLFTRRRIASPREVRSHLNWAAVRELAEDNADFGLFEQWISSCLMEEHAWPINEFSAREKLPKENVA